MGIHVNPWLIHVNVWKNPLQYCKVISLQLIKINEKKKDDDGRDLINWRSYSQAQLSYLKIKQAIWEERARKGGRKEKQESERKRERETIDWLSLEISREKSSRVVMSSDSGFPKPLPASFPVSLCHALFPVFECSWGFLLDTYSQSLFNLVWVGFVFLQATFL